MVRDRVLWCREHRQQLLSSRMLFHGHLSLYSPAASRLCPFSVRSLRRSSSSLLAQGSQVWSHMTIRAYTVLHPITRPYSHLCPSIHFSFGNFDLPERYLMRAAIEAGGYRKHSRQNFCLPCSSFLSSGALSRSPEEGAYHCCRYCCCGSSRFHHHHIIGASSFRHVIPDYYYHWRVVPRILWCL